VFRRYNDRKDKLFQEARRSSITPEQCNDHNQREKPDPYDGVKSKTNAPRCKIGENVIDPFDRP